MEDVFDEHRNIGPHRHGQRRHAERQHDQRLHRALFANELDTLLQAGKHRVASACRQESGPDHQQRNDGCKEGKRIQPEAPLLSQLRQSLAGECGSNGDRQVELDRVQRDGVGHVLSVDQRRNQRRVRRAAKGLGQAGHKRETKDRPNVGQSVGHQDSKDRRTRHLYVLRGEQDFPALDAVGHHAADQREQEDGNAAEKLVEREQEGGMAQAIDEPALGHDLHPGADARGAGTDPHQPEIAIMKCFEYSAQG